MKSQKWGWSLLVMVILLGGVVLSGAMDSSWAQQPMVLEFAGYNQEGDVYTTAHNWWGKEIEKKTGGKVKINFHWGGSLLGPKDLTPGVGRGAADGGLIAAVMTPELFPLTHCADAIYVTESPDAAGKAFTEMIRTYEPLIAEWKKSNIKVITFQPIGGMVMGFKKKVEKLEDMKGLKIRVVGKYANTIEKLGAVPAMIAMPEIYEALKRGTIDGIATITLDLYYALALHEVGKYVLNPGFGCYGVSVATGFNMDTWNKMPEDVKKAIMEVSDGLIDKEVELMMALESKAKQAIPAAGGVLYQLSDKEKARWKKAVTPDEYLEAMEKKGLPAKQMFNQYLDLVKKYEKTSKYTSPFAK